MLFRWRLWSDSSQTFSFRTRTTRAGQDLRVWVQMPAIYLRIFKCRWLPSRAWYLRSRWWIEAYRQQVEGVEGFGRVFFLRWFGLQHQRHEWYQWFIQYALHMDESFLSWWPLPTVLVLLCLNLQHCSWFPDGSWNPAFSWTACWSSPHLCFWSDLQD